MMDQRLDLLCGRDVVTVCFVYCLRSAPFVSLCVVCALLYVHVCKLELT